MRVPINWLEEFINVDSSLEKLSDKLLRLGIEVEQIGKSSILKGIKVGKVLSVKKHPSADKLTVCRVALGEGSPKQIICGASNVEEGIKVAVILAGNVLPSGLKIEKRPIRGIESEGMMCSREELELEDNSGGIWVLPDKCGVGEELCDEIETDDAVIDIKVTPNRGDCLSILGIARELAALDGQKLKLPPTAVRETKEKIINKISVEVKDSSLCSRYTARMLEGVQVKDSPYWLRKRLVLAGVRPINNVVDITNYVMLEVGQPLHAFDYEKLALGGRVDKKIVIRRARDKEKILCLDGVQRELSSDNLVIADGKKPVALAGIMGGEDTGVDKNTQTLVIESANFSPTFIRKTSKSLNIASESSYRFERSVDPEGTTFAANRACYLMQELAGAKVISGTVDIKGKIEQKTISFNPSEIERILGTEIPSYNKILRRLGFKTKKAGNRLKVKVPNWRSDIKEEIDLIEEIARINDYDLIPLSLPSGRMPALKEDRKEKVIKKCRSILNRLSLNEVVNFSFLSADLIKKSFGILEETVGIDNAISEEFEILRYSLIPSLLQTAEENISRDEKNIRIFELRSIYEYGEGKSIKENIHLGILLTGEWQEPSWLNSGQKASFHVLKAIIDILFKEFGIKVSWKREKHPLFNETFTFSVLKDGVRVGVIGETNSNIMENFSLKEKAYIAELNLGLLLPSVELKRKVKPVPKYPPVVRDFSFIVPDRISSEQIEETVINECEGLIERMKLFDYYKGKQVPEGHKSMSYSLYFRSAKKTLTDEEVTDLQDKIIKKLEKLGLKLRS